MKSQIYLDYNATSPLSESVKAYLTRGDFAYANPSSVHTLGKTARKTLNETKSFLYSLFSLNDHDYRLIFHSGATEGIRSFFESCGAGDLFVYSLADHSAVHAMAGVLKVRGCTLLTLELDQDGVIDLKASVKKILKVKQTLGKTARVFLNYTQVNNETGVYWPLDLALKLKEKTQAYLHVDATQSPGRYPNWCSLEELDGLTYSGHKFGALKGIGFSFVHKTFPFTPLLLGSHQESSLRAGTENTMGIQSIELALKDAVKINIERVCQFRDELEQILSSHPDIEIIGKDALYSRAVNTCGFIHRKLKADLLQMHFDLAGLALSPGAACSAGSLNPSKSLLAVGRKEDAHKLLRLSIGEASLEHRDEIILRMQGVLKKI